MGLQLRHKHKTATQSTILQPFQWRFTVLHYWSLFLQAQWFFILEDLRGTVAKKFCLQLLLFFSQFYRNMIWETVKCSSLCSVDAGEWRATLATTVALWVLKWTRYIRLRTSWRQSANEMEAKETISDRSSPEQYTIKIMNTLGSTLCMHRCVCACALVRMCVPWYLPRFVPKPPIVTRHLFIFRFKQQQRAVSEDKEPLSAPLPGISSLYSSGTLCWHPPPIMFLWHSKQDLCRKSCQAQLLIGWTL